MNCEQSKQYYLASQIEAADINNQNSFETHTRTCVSCQAFILSEKALTKALNDYPAENAFYPLRDTK